MSTDAQVMLFAAYGITSQVLLLAYFAARRWRIHLAERYGWIAYAFGVVGLVVGAWLWASGASYRLFSGPLLFAAWSAFGAAVDLWRRVEWRSPIRWSILVPYVVLYLAAQMFLWWPLWDFMRGAWAVYLVLFVANTALNIGGHFGPRSRPVAGAG